MAPGKPKEIKLKAAAGSNRRVRFNIGGTKYEVSRSVINKFPDSMVSKICSDTWNNNEKEDGDDVDNDNDDDDDDDEGELFIERDGERFRYVLDYMRDGSVQLPLSIPRGQLVMDLEYYGIDYDDESITLSVADPKDLFRGLARYNDFFDQLEAKIEVDYKVAVAQKAACLVAKKFFGNLCTGEKPAPVIPPSHRGHQYQYLQEQPKPPRSPTCFDAQTIVMRLPFWQVCLKAEDLQPHFKAVGLFLVDDSTTRAQTLYCDASSDYTTFAVTFLKPSL
jgi:BTB/POZ domain